MGCLAVILTAWLAGCATSPLHDQVYGTGYTPTNYFRAAPTLAPSIKRVAVLPLTVAPGTPDEARETLEPVLQAQLARSGMVEWSFVPPDSLRRITGRASWSADDPLPNDFLEKIQEKYGCQAVLFSHLARYRPFRPVALGWRFKLVDCSEARIWWAADEVFDSGVAAVAASARRYYQAEIRPRAVHEDSKMILESPRLFSQYAVQNLLDTLPGR